ncbi:LPS export ABC transporter periplasmic protein LptC [Sulfurimonas sp.]|uniref:LPS export ABC transporter periplasmic protein LptC n=1 Tax=Sulfurimonas sp. TaxID=2022749 RepID=UPI0025EE6139|nr:LPS export ABC transporter periplasmic protein LptC [Sulfurimonas sp.]MDD5156950.1 LPS export ABC transporter periplasmic protein LptC [Sulfurimonas sp.]
MNINIFFVLVASILLAIFAMFKPIYIKQREFVDVPVFDISNFLMYELNVNGLKTFIKGDKATKYADRDTVENIDYTDNSKKYMINIKAKNGIYKDKVVYLDGDVVFFREDGLTFETQKAVYDKITTIARADGDYLIHRAKNSVVGRELKYNNQLNSVSAKDISAIFQLKESKK